MELRSLTDAPELARAVRKLNLGVLPVQPPEFVYRRATRDSHHLSWAAVLPGTDEVAGGVVAELEPDARAPTRAVVAVRTLAVAPRHRRKGVGRALLEQVIQQTREVMDRSDSGEPTVHGLSLHVHVANADAVQFYERIGFREQARLEGYYRRLEPATAVLMCLALP
jgi:ribosomal protein S18 acetylase RimI-like enzyme